MILVDTPLWSLALRRTPDNLGSSDRRSIQLLSRMINEGRVELLGPVRQELLSGIREEAQFRRMRDFLRAFPDTTVSANDYEQAAHCSNLCRRAGVASSPVDMLICALAIRHDWEIFSTDGDFANYKPILNIQLIAKQ